MKVKAGQTDGSGNRATFPKSTHHIILDTIEGRKYMCGPYWESLIDVFDIKHNDKICFHFNKSGWFDVNIYANEGLEKYWRNTPGKIF